MDQLLIIPGMGDKTRVLELLTKNWPERFNLQPNIVAFGWENSADEYEQRQAAILAETDRLSKLSSLSVIGVSAGGHKAIHLLAERPDVIKSAVNICGLSRMEGWSGGGKRHALLRRSLGIFVGREYDPSKVMTLRPLKDELVPASTVPIEGATNIRMCTLGHSPSIVWALTGRARTIANFINYHSK